MTTSNLFDTPAYTMSLLGPRPIVARVVELNELIVFWGGVILPYAAALYLATREANVYPSPNVKKHINNSFRRLRFTGALKKGDRPFNREMKPTVSVDDVLPGFERLTRVHLAKLRQTHTTAQLFAMLNADNAIEIFLSKGVDERPRTPYN